MNKELQKLLKQINDKKNEVKSLVNDGKTRQGKGSKRGTQGVTEQIRPPL